MGPPDDPVYAERVPPPLVTRFAPSPTGRLHLGHAYSALLNFDLAKSLGGSFRVRIEDIDQTRCRPEFEDAIRKDLLWLAIEADGDIPRQSERFDLYQTALMELADRGLIYRCFKTRAEHHAALSAPQNGTPVQPAWQMATGPLIAKDEQRLLDDGRAFAWRLDAKRIARTLGAAAISWRESIDGQADIQHAIDLSVLTDDVIARKDVPTSYHLASVVDDAAQGVTLVWRGEDLQDAIPLHRVLQELLGLPAPSYRHHRLITDAKGRRLAKRDKAETLAALREAGTTPADVRRRLGLPIADEPI
ncbi:MAG: tRNA glutamyl-Q(34) synthetase GluQRS [Pseudomonadota bacterium]